MKNDIHPKWFPEATIVCSTCGTTWTTGATKPEIRLDICSNCHPFYTGEQRIVDTEGQVDRFYKRLQARDSIAQEQADREAARTSPEVSLDELGLNTRQTNLLNDNGFQIVGDVLAKFEAEGDDGLLSIQGFGRKALVDLKKKLRERGYQIVMPEGVEA